MKEKLVITNRSEDTTVAVLGEDVLDEPITQAEIDRGQQLTDALDNDRRRRFKDKKDTLEKLRNREACMRAMFVAGAALTAITMVLGGVAVPWTDDESERWFRLSVFVVIAFSCFVPCLLGLLWNMFYWEKCSETCRRLSTEIWEDVEKAQLAGRPLD